jgi:hypothetical protein
LFSFLIFSFLFFFIIVVDVDAVVDVVNSFKFYSGHEISDDGFDSIQFNSIQFNSIQSIMSDDESIDDDESNITKLVLVLALVLVPVLISSQTEHIT